MTQPNIVVVVMDTARGDYVLGEHAGTPVTPSLESMAESGTHFRNAFAPAPWTLPSHASLFTGTFPSKHGAHAGHKHLDEQLTTLPEAFSAGGYETVAVSNNTWISEGFGFDRGFDRFFKTWQYVQSETDLGTIARARAGFNKHLAAGKELFSGNPVVNLVNAVYGRFVRKRRDSGAARSNRWIRRWLRTRAEDRPFFLFVNYLEPHLEYRPPRSAAAPFLPPGVSYEEAMATPQDAWAYLVGETDIDSTGFAALKGLYAGELAYLDERIGELRSVLERHGYWKNSIVVVTSDHGENIGDHGLMDHQYCLYDTLLHVPLILTGGAFHGEASSDSLVQLTDLAPTLLEEVDIEAPTMESQLQGQPLPIHGRNERSRVFAEYLAPQPSIATLEERFGPLPESVESYDRALRAIRTVDAKLITGSDGSRECYWVVDGTAQESQAGESTDGPVARGLEATLDEWYSSFEHAEGETPVSIPADVRDSLEDLGYLQ